MNLNSNQSDLEWIEEVRQAQLAQVTTAPVKSEAKSALLFALLPIAMFGLAFLFPRQLERPLLLFYFVGGLSSVALIWLYASTSVVSVALKERALGFLLGLLMVFLLVTLKPI
ncbi:hypothetical protein EON80_14920 [bacterium]|nr:MAG: hypothetical protein EON80_14920 [bacterium]